MEKRFQIDIKSDEVYVWDTLTNRSLMVGEQDAAAYLLIHDSLADAIEKMHEAMAKMPFNAFGTLDNEAVETFAHAVSLIRKSDNRNRSRP